MTIKKVKSMADAVRDSYQAGEEDEALEPIVLVDEDGKPIGRMANGDYVIFYNIRGEREIELTESLTDEHFDEFPTKEGLKLNFATMIEYDKKLEVKVAFPPIGKIDDTLSEVISKNNLKQVKIVESEKAVHVNFFLNGRVHEPFPGEERIIVPTPKDVEYFDQQPEMNIAGVTEAILRKMADDSCDVIIANFANTDVVGHIENEAAIKSALEAVDTNVGIVVDKAQEAGMTVVITADHGTVEKWLYEDGAINTGHTDSPVPFILIDPHATGPTELLDSGGLIDVAPTILALFGIEQPEAMTGGNLIINYQERTDHKRRVLLLIVDGFGENEQTKGNLIAQANTPVIDRLRAEYPSTILQAAGEAVGMPEGTVGNSESGHLHLGAGRVIPADRMRIKDAIADGSFFENEAFLWTVKGAKRDNTRLHLLGIVSFYSSHGSVDYLFALLELARREGLQDVYVHSMLGRRGEHPESGALYIEKAETETERLNVGKVVTVIGRFWALDREENWDRVEKTYRAFVSGNGKHVMIQDED